METPKLISRCFLVGIVVAGFAAAGRAAEKPSALPAGYKLLYEQDFHQPSALQDFAMTDPKAWKWSKDEKGSALELVSQSNYQPAVRSPVNIALIADK